MVMNDGKAVYAGGRRDDDGLCGEGARQRPGYPRARSIISFRIRPMQRMMNTIAHQLEIPPERTRSTIENFGNSSAATIPFTLVGDSRR